LFSRGRGAVQSYEGTAKDVCVIVFRERIGDEQARCFITP
jgi:hypothetical protein